MNSRSDLFELGKVTKPKGIKGEIDIFLDSDNPEYYKNLESVLIELNHELVPFFIETIRISGRFATVKCDGISSFEDAAKLVGSVVFLPLEKLPTLKGNRFYFHDLKGANVIDKTMGNIGIIMNIYDNTEQPLAEIIINGNDILFPLLERFIEKFDKESKTLYVNLPEGLVNLYIQ